MFDSHIMREANMGLECLVPAPTFETCNSIGQNRHLNRDCRYSRLGRRRTPKLLERRPHSADQFFEVLLGDFM